MKSIQGTAVQQPVTIAQRVDFSQAYANVINATCKLARVGAIEPDVTMDKLSEIIDFSAMSREEWMRSVFLKAGGAEASAGFADLLLTSEVGQSKAVQALAPIIKNWLAALISTGVVRQDWGLCTFNDLAESARSGLAAHLGILPASGYPRTVLVNTASIFTAAQLAYMLPHQTADRVSAVALDLIRLDRHRFTFAMFAPPDTLEFSIEKRDRQFGDMLSVKHILEALWTLSALYRTAAMRLIYSVSTRQRALGRAHYAARLNIASDAMLMDETGEKEFTSLPQHPLGSYFESVWATGQIATDLGTHEVIWYDTSTAVETWLGYAQSPLECGDAPAQVALHYETYLQGLATMSAFGSGPCAARAWEGFKEKEQVNTVYQSPLQFTASIKGTPRLWDRMSAMAKVIGWSSLSGSIGTLDALGADFAITDGVMCSVPVDQVLLGLTPCLSLGNIKARGLALRFDSGFMKDGPPAVSVLPLLGKVEAGKTNENIERMAIPIGMVIDEPNVEYVNMFSLGLTPIAQAAQAYFVAKMQMYPTLNYLAIVPPPDQQEVVRTDWDTYGYTGSAAAPVSSLDRRGHLVSMWNQALLDSRQGVPAKDAIFAVRIDGQQFYGRELAVNTRTDEYDVISQIGIYIQRQPYQHIVVFDNTFDLGYTFKDLDKLLALTPALKSRGVEAGLPVEVLTQAIAKDTLELSK